MKKFFSVLISLILVTSFSSEAFAVVYGEAGWETEGRTEATAWEINSASVLAKVRDDINNKTINYKAYYKLTKDIDITSYKNWEPIGKIDRYDYSDPKYYFQGVFDGNGHKITVNIDTSSSANLYAGVFGAVKGGTIKNLSVEGNINARTLFKDGAVGGIAAYLFSGTIQNCRFDGNLLLEVVREWSCTGRAGGIIGHAGGSGLVVISDCKVGSKSDTYITATDSYYNYNESDCEGGIVGHFIDSNSRTQLTGNSARVFLSGKCKNSGSIYGKREGLLGTVSGNNSYDPYEAWPESDDPVVEELVLSMSFGKTGELGKTYSGNATVTGGISPYIWDYEGNIPKGLSFSSSENKATISGTPTKAGKYNFTVIVQDSQGNKKTASSSITIEEPEDDLVLKMSFGKTGEIGTAYSGKATASGGTSPYTWDYEGNIPKGLTFKSSGNKATISGTPTKEGKFNFTIILKDSNGNKQTASTSITIEDNTDPDDNGIEISLDFDDTGELETYYQGTATVSGGTKPYEWDYEGDLPPGLELTPNSKGTKVTLKGYPTEAGEFTFVLQVKDKNGETEEEVVKITISEPEPDPVEISEINFESSWTLKKSYSGTAKAKNGVAPYEWSVDGDLPPGLEIQDQQDEDWSEVEISGKPVTAGTYSFNLVVTDSKGDSVEEAVVITITAPKLSGKFTETSLLKKSYSSYVKVAGGEAPYTVKKSSGTLPTGLKLSVSGTKIYLKGTPKEAGTFKFKIKVTDKNKATVSKSYTVTITAPEITGTFKDGVINKTYSGTAKVSGGVSPYTWKYSGLPAGLEFSQNEKGTKATFKGKPTKAKTYNLKLTVTDKNGAKSIKTFTFKIAKKASTTKTLESSVDSLMKITTPVSMNENFISELISLEIFEEDILSKGEGKDEDLIEVKADEPLRFIIGEWPVEVSANEIEIYVDDKAVDVEISDDGKFELPAEFVHDDFNVQAKSGEFETIELFISAK